MQPIKDVLNHYQQSYSGTRRATITNSPDQKAILKGLPEFFKQVVKRKRNLDDFKIEGSIGNGNIAQVPWVGVFHRSVTTSAQNGYYIVLLFAQDMQSCTLSLNQGVTDIAKRYTPGIARAKVREYADRAVKYFSPAAGAILGPIELAAKGTLGKGYEAAAIESFRYESTDLPCPQVLAEHLEQLLEHYERLIQVVGHSMEALAPLTEEEYQRAAQENVVDGQEKKSDSSKDKDEPQKKRTPIQTSAGEIYPRDGRVARKALAMAQYRCEVDPHHLTFTSLAKKRPYIEAHHLVPMSLQKQFETSLDVAANVVGLCAHCHKLLHLGLPVDKEPLLLKLFDERSHRLGKVGIPMDQATLVKHYKVKLAEDAA